MSRLFVIGIGPLMDGRARRVTAHAVRAWHFVAALRRAGHEVSLCTISQLIDPATPEIQFVEERVKDGMPYRNIDLRLGNLWAYLREQCESFRPDGVAGVGTEPAAWACRILPTAPVWADLHGWVMAEAQLKAAADGSDDILSYFWRYERSVLRRADRISAVSDAQRFALLGELATVGRLNRYTVNHDLVVTIPSAADLNETAANAADSPPPPMPIAALRDARDAFVVLWSGAFNTWTDADTLFAALEYAMERDASIHFVATGGAVPGLVENIFETFRRHAERSSFRARYHLVGWVAAEDFPAYVRNSHAAICVDRPCLETSLGTRTRLLGTMAAGLPPLLTLGTELSRSLKDGEIGWVVEPRDPKALGEAIVARARNRAETAEMGRRAREFVARRYSLESTLAPFLQWAEKPAFAPDNAVKRKTAPTMVEVPLNEMEADACALDEGGLQALLEARRDLHLLRSRWPIRLWRSLCGKQ